MAAAGTLQVRCPACGVALPISTEITLQGVEDDA